MINKLESVVRGRRFQANFLLIIGILYKPLNGLIYCSKVHAIIVYSNLQTNHTCILALYNAAIFWDNNVEISQVLVSRWYQKL